LDSISIRAREVLVSMSWLRPASRDSLLREILQVPTLPWTSLPKPAGDPQQRVLSRIQKNRIKLGGSPDPLAPFPPKPPGLHWSTYFRKWEEDEKAVARYIEEFGWRDRAPA
jgi:hypothetical protein